ncbi:MAG TPA: hypothetical protein VFC35_07330, partial [Gemmatimonadaceae bacterium]|nr:hypothetical protein [Gemmatimonadaceae bacterium]
QKVRRAQRLLGIGAVTAALAWGVASTLGILAAASLVTWISPTIQVAPEWLAIVSLAAGLAVVAALIWRARHVGSFARVALWIEESLPSLQYSLVTAVEPERSAFADGIESAVEHEDISGVASRALRRIVLPAIAAAAIAGLLLYISPASALTRGGFLGRLTGSGRNASAVLGNRLEKISVDLTPPSYTGERTSTLDDPSSVTALIGSRLVVRGDGSSEGVTAILAGSTVQTRDAGGGWSVSVAMPAKPAALTLHDRQFERIVVLDPRADNAPKIVLLSPARDTTMRVAQLVLHLNATATDDIGLSGAYFEYLITTGSGEVFSARTITTPVVSFGNSRTGSISSTLDLATLKLNQGDVVSIRAIAQDGNTVGGPGLATSDTRTFRIARADEYDSVAVDAAAPPPVDSSALSQRMLIMMTEQLVKEEKKLSHAEVVRRSGEIGDMEDRVRKRVHEILFEGEDLFGQEKAGDPPPDIEQMEPPDNVTQAKNPDLSLAYNALWQAVRSLQIAEPDSALPPMRVALKALDKVRLANRLYLRGIPPKVIVDIARVRMAGKEKGFASTRTPRSAADSSHADLERRFSDAIELLARTPATAVRDLTLLRVEALSVSPSFAAALSDAVDAFHKGKDATLPLLRARRALSGEPVAKPGLPSWSGTW